MKYGTELVDTYKTMKHIEVYISNPTLRMPLNCVTDDISSETLNISDIKRTFQLLESYAWLTSQPLHESQLLQLQSPDDLYIAL
jgi:hypothetical protein